MKFRIILGSWILAAFALSGPAIADDKKKSGEKAGTEDINIGVGELNEDKKGAKRKAAKKQRKKAKKKAAKPKIKRKKADEDREKK